MTAIHIPGFSRTHRPVAPIIDPEPHWIDLTTNSPDSGFAERSARYLLLVGYTEEEVRKVLMAELDMTVDDVEAIVRRTSNHELQSA